MTRRPQRTDHQREIMGVVLREFAAGRVLSQPELFALLDYHKTNGAAYLYGSFRKKIENLEEVGMVVRERKGKLVYVHPTMKGFDWFRPAR